MAIAANLLCMIILGYLVWYLLNAHNYNDLNDLSKKRKPRNRGQSESSTHQQETQNNR